MSDPIAPLISALHNQGRLRVWSLVITVFGDLVQDRGGVISTARLGALLGRVGVEKGTLRTALSRLGRDGWVTRLRQGRTSLYRLSAEGVAEFAPATARIYAPPPADTADDWEVTVKLGPDGSPCVTVEPAGSGDGAADLRLRGDITEMSDAYCAALLGAEHELALNLLAADLAALEAADIATPLDSAAARLLLIHRWRRIALRHDDIHPHLMPASSPLGNPRRAVAQAYRRLTPLTEEWLASPIGETGAMPDARPGTKRRFEANQEP